MFIPVNYRKIIWKVALWLTESASLIQKFHVNHRCLRDLIIIMFGEIFEGMRLIRNITPRSVIMMIVHRDMKQIMKLKFHVSIVALPLLSRLCFIVSDCRSTMYQSEIFSENHSQYFLAKFDTGGLLGILYLPRWGCIINIH